MPVSRTGPASCGIARQIAGSAVLYEPGLNEDAENRQLAVGGAVHEVYFQVKVSTRQQVLARVMKMELQQVVALAVDDGVIAGRRVDLDRVTVVEHRKREDPEVGAHLADLGTHGVLQIDGDCCTPRSHVRKSASRLPHFSVRPRRRSPNAACGAWPGAQRSAARAACSPRQGGFRAARRPRLALSGWCAW